MDRVIKHGLQVAASLTADSKKDMRAALHKIFTEESHIDFSTPENIQALKEFASLFRDVFDLAGNKNFDFSKFINLTDPIEMFNELKASAKEFGDVWSSITSQIGSNSLQNIFMKNRHELDTALARLTNSKGEMSKKNLESLNKAINGDVKSKDINYLMNKVIGAKGNFLNSITWEERTKAAIEYYNTVQRIGELTHFDILEAQDKGMRMHDFGGVFKELGNLGPYTIQQIESALPYMKASLQNILNLSEGSPLVGLTEGGAVDISVVPKVVKTIDIKDITGGKDKVEVPVELVATSGSGAEAKAKATKEAIDRLNVEFDVDDLDSDALVDTLTQRQQDIKYLEQEGQLTEELRTKHEQINVEIQKQIDLLSAVRKVEKSLEEINEMDYHPDDLDEVQEALNKRREIINLIPEDVIDYSDYVYDDVERIKQENEELEKRVTLLKQVKQGLIDASEVDDILNESGTLDSKLSRLEDVAYNWGSNIKDSEVDEDDDALETLREFEETYDRIVLKLYNGRKIEILPNAKGLRALYKYDDGVDHSAYGESEIEDVEFVRKETQIPQEQVVVVEDIAEADKESADATERAAKARAEELNIIKAMQQYQEKYAETQRNKETAAFINTKSGDMSEFFVGEEHQVSFPRGTFAKMSEQYDMEVHSHNYKTAAPSVRDLELWFKVIDSIKKFGIRAGEELLTLDFSSFSETDLEKFLQKYKELDARIDAEFHAMSHDERIEKFGSEKGIEEAIQVRLREGLEEIVKGMPGIIKSIPMPKLPVAETPAASVPTKSKLSLADEYEKANDEVKELIRNLAILYKQQDDDVDPGDDEIDSVFEAEEKLRAAIANDPDMPNLLKIANVDFAQWEELGQRFIDEAAVRKQNTIAMQEEKDAQEKLNAVESQNPSAQNEAPVHNANAEAAKKEAEEVSKLQKLKEFATKTFGGAKKFVANKKFKPEVTTPVVDTAPVTSGVISSTDVTPLVNEIKALTSAINTKMVDADTDTEAKSISTEDLKSVLESITYKVSITSDVSESPNPPEPPTQQNDGDVGAEQAPWALESTLNTTIKNILEGIRTNTAKKSGGGKSQGGQALNGTLSAVKESLNKVAVALANINTQQSPQDAPAPKEAKKSPINVDDRLDKLAELEAMLKSTDNITEQTDKQIKELFDSLNQVDDASGLAKWDKQFAEFSNKIQSLKPEYEKLGKLMAQRDILPEGKRGKIDAEIRAQEKIIKLKEEEIGLNHRLFDTTESEAYYAEREKQMGKLSDEARKEDERRSKQDFKLEVQKSRDTAQLTRAKSTGNSAQDVLGRLNGVELTPEQLMRLEEYHKALDNLNNTYQNLRYSKDGIIDPEDAQLMKNQTAEVRQFNTEFKMMLKQYDDLSGDNVEVVGQNILGKDADWKAMKQQLTEVAMKATEGKGKIGAYNAETGELSVTVKKGAHEVENYVFKMRDLGGALVQVAQGTTRVATPLEAIGKKLKELSYYFTGSAMIYKGINEVKKGIQYVREIDSALTELKKVTNETEETYDRFLDTASKTADRLGSTIKEVVSSTADFARLGYNLKDAAMMAESAQVLMNVSEFTDISSATDTLISAMQAFKYTAEESMDVVNILNIIGNNYAISTSDLAESLTRSSASLVAAGNSLEQAAALTVAGNTILQDPEGVGNALKVVAMRIRGTKSELEAAGEETDGLVESTSKLQAKIQSLAGVNILNDDGSYKDTYTILYELGKVYENLNDLAQADLLETIAGKTRGSAVAAILQNYELLEDAYNTSLDAEGSAARELDIYLDSIQGKIDQFTNAMQTLWSNTLDDSWIKGIVDFGTEIVKLIDKIGVFKSILGGAFIYLTAFKKNNPLDWIKSVGTYLSAFKNNGGIGQFLGSLIGIAPAMKMMTAETVANTIALQVNDAEKTKSILSSIGLTNSTQALSIAQRKQAIETLIAQQSTNGLKNEQIMAMAASWGLKTGIDATTGSVKILDVTTKSLMATNPVGWILGIISAVVTLTSVIIPLVDNTKKVAEAAEEALSAYDQAQDTLRSHKKTIEEISDDYKKLADGVDSLGRNVSLSTDEYKRYNEITNQIAEMFPEMVSGYTEEGNAIIALKGNVEALTEAYEKEAQAARDAIIVKSNDIFDNFKNNVNKATWSRAAKTEQLGYLETMINDPEKADRDWNSQGTAPSTYRQIFNDLDIDYSVFDDVNDIIEENKDQILAQYHVLKSEIEAEAAPVTSLINAYLGNDKDYQKLSDEGKNIAQTIISGFDTEFYNRKEFKHWTDVASWIDTNVVQKLQDVGNMAEFTAIFDLQTQFNDGKIPVDEYIDKITEFTELLRTLGFGEEIIKTVKGAFDIEDYVPKQNVAKDLLEDQYDNMVGQLTKSDLDIIDKYKNEWKLPNGVLYSWEELIELIKLAKQGVEEPSIADSLGKISSLEEAYNSLGEAVQEFKEEGTAASDTLESLRETFGKTEGFEELYKVLATGEGNVEEAITNVANAYIGQAEILSDLTDEELQIMIARLKALGVVNTEEIMQSRQVAQEKLNSALTGYNIDLSAYATTEEAKLAIAQAMHLDVASISDDTVNKLIEHYGIELGEYATMSEKKIAIAQEVARETAKLNRDSAVQTLRNEYTDKYGRNLGNTDFMEKVAGIYAEYDKTISDINASGAAIENISSIVNDYYSTPFEFDFNNNLVGIGRGFDEQIGDGKDEDDNRLENLQKKYEGKISNLENQKTWLENEIAREEEIGLGVSKSYYEEKIEIEEKLIDEYEKERAELIALQNLYPQGSEKWYETADAIWEVEHQMQESTANIISNGKEIINLYDEVFSKISEAYDSKISISDDRIASMENYAEILDLQGGTATKGLYDAIIAESEDKLATQLEKSNKLNDAIEALKAEENTAAPGSDEWEAFELAREQSIIKSREEHRQLKLDIQETTTEIENQKEAFKELATQRWDEVREAYDNRDQYYQNQIDLNDKYIEKLETLGINVPDSAYQNQIASLESASASKWEEYLDARKEMIDYEGIYGADSQEYIDKYNETIELHHEYLDYENEILAKQQQIFDNQIDRFDQTIDRINNSTKRMQNISSLLDGKDVAAEDGEWTAEGLTQLGMAYQQMEYYKQSSESVVAQMAEVEAAYKRGEIGEQKYYETMKSLESQQWDAINSYEDMKDSIVDLNEARIDMIEEGLNKEAEAYEELIQLKRDQLDAERDLYDFRKDTQKQQKDIAALERRIVSMSGSTDAATIAEKTKLEQQLREAQENLNDTYYNHSMDSKSQALDKELEAYNKSSEDYLKSLRESIEDVDLLVEQTYTKVLQNSDTVLKTIEASAEEYKFYVDDYLTSPWKNASNASLDFETYTKQHIDAIKFYVETTNPELEKQLGFSFDNLSTDKAGNPLYEYSQYGKKAMDVLLFKAKVNRHDMKSELEGGFTDSKGAIEGWGTDASNAVQSVINKFTDKDTGLIAALNKTADRISSMPKYDGGYTEPTPPSTKPDSNSNPSPAPVKNNPYSGQFSQQVSDLQWVLIYGFNLPVGKNARGNNKYTADGYWGATTEASLKEAQKQIDASRTGRFDEQTRNKMSTWLTKQYNNAPDNTKYQKALRYLPAKAFAKGTLGTTRDQLAITDESWIGEEITLAAGKNGQLQYLKKGSAVLPADISANLVEWGKLDPNMIGMSGVGANLNVISNAVNKPELNLSFDSLVHVDNCSQETLKDLEKMVDIKINQFSKQMNYSIKRFK